jgi:hypothetical protein
MAEELRAAARRGDLEEAGRVAQQLRREQLDLPDDRVSE